MAIRGQNPAVQDFGAIAERLAVIEAGARQSLIDCLDPNEGVWTRHHRTLAVSRADRYAAAKAANSRADLLAALNEDLAYLEKMLFRSHCEHWPYELRAAIDHTRKAIERTKGE
jgi:hypothetical protein